MNLIYRTCLVLPLCLTVANANALQPSSPNSVKRPAPTRSTGSTTSQAGVNGGRGGGIRAKVDGKWVVLDDIEAGGEFDVTQEPAYAKVQEVLAEVAQEVPSFVAEMQKALKKTWHRVPYEMNCEDADSPIAAEVIDPACQNDNDVWINQDELARDDAYKIIIHELVQSIRLAKNSDRERRFLPASATRAIAHAIYSKPLIEERALADKVAKYGFGDYMTSAEESIIQQEKASYIHDVCASGQFNWNLWYKRCEDWCKKVGDSRVTPALQDGYLSLDHFAGFSGDICSSAKER